MARMKFLCDADRCIECNACVTACKNENEVPWGINRRRVVTINDGKPGRTLGLDGLHALHRCALHGGLSGQLLLHDRRWRGSALQRSMHRLRLLLLRLPIRRAAISARRKFRVARQNGQMHVTALAVPSRTTRSIQYEKYGANRLCRGQAAAVRRDVFDQGAARRRWRDHRGDL